MSNTTVLGRRWDSDREVENIDSTDHALHVLPSGLTFFNEQQTAEFSPIIELDSSNGLSTVYRDTVTTTGSANVTNSNGEHNLSTGTTAGSTAKLRTKERGRYQPGIQGLVGIAVRRPTAMSSDQEIRWGYFDDTDGFIFGEDSTGIFVRHRHNSTDEDKVYQPDWNVDTLDGSGDSNNPSGLSLDQTLVNIFRINFAWYGQGPAEMQILTVGAKNRPRLLTVHRFGQLSGEPILANPKLPINAEADNGTTTTDVNLFVVGRHFAVIGRYNPNRRNTSQDRLGVSTSTTVIPLVTFKKKTDRESQAKSTKINGINVLTDTNSIASIILGGSLTNASFGAPSGIDASETALQVDTSATAISGGTVIDKTAASGGQGASSDLTGIRGLGVDIPEDTNVTLAIRTVSGTGTASAVFTAEEEF